MNFSRALLMDIGNTRVKWGVLEKNKFGKTGSLTHEKIRDAGIQSLTTRLPRRVDRVYVCNVAGPNFATRLSAVIRLHCSTEIHFVRVARTAFGITNSYRQVRRLGVDRWVAMIGAFAEFKCALCVVDAGTAVTLDALDSDGMHLGGQIIPGLRLMVEALVSQTSNIDAATQSPRNGATGMARFGNNTGAAVRNGAMSAVCGAVEAAVRRLRSAGYRPKIVLTGGDASRILKQIDVKLLHRPHLVLQGLAYMVQSES